MRATVLPAREEDLMEKGRMYPFEQLLTGAIFGFGSGSRLPVTQPLTFCERHLSPEMFGGSRVMPKAR